MKERFARFLWPDAVPHRGAQRVIVHEWLTALGGSDKVAAALAEIADADVVYSFAVDRSLVDRLGIETPVVTWRWGERLGTSGWFRLLLPIMPVVWSLLELSNAKLVITSSHSCSNSVLTPNAHRVSYCHTPMRYAWYPEIERRRVGRASRFILPVIATIFRGLDRRWSYRVDTYVANSTFVAERIRVAYARCATVVPPPIDLNRWTPSQPSGARTGFLAAGRFVPYKRFDLAIEAANAAAIPLTVAGSGPDLSRLKSLAGPTVKFVIDPSDGELRSLFTNSRAVLFPGIEDFGMLPVEAQACGTPVIARAEGGALDTVIGGRTGVLLASDAVDDWANALSAFDDNAFECSTLVAHAASFDANRFCERMADSIERRESADRRPINDDKSPRPLISIVMPARNEAAVIGRGLTSIVEQESFGPQVEIVVVDDASTDDTAAIAKRFPNTRVVACDGSGITDGLNTGLKAAVGDIVVRLDADDWFLDGALTRLTAPLLADPDLHLVAGGAVEIDEHGRFLGDLLPPVDDRHLRFVNLAGCVLTHSAVAFRRVDVIDIGGYQDEHAAEDFDLWVRMMRAGFKMTGDSTLVTVREIRRHSITATRNHEQHGSARQIRNAARDDITQPLPALVESLFSDLRNRDDFARERRDLQFRTLRIAVALWRDGERANGRSLAITTVRHGPFAMLRALAHGVARRQRSRIVRGV